MAENVDNAELIEDIREQVLYLQELGVESLEANLPAALKAADAGKETRDERQETRQAPPIRREVSVPVADVKPERPPAGSRLASLPSLSARKPSSFFDKYNPREQPAEPEPKGSSPAPSFEEIQHNAEGYLSHSTSDSEIALVGSVEKGHDNPNRPYKTDSENEKRIWEIWAEIGSGCTRCPLGTLGRKQVVNSVGNFNAELMFVGEAPGADEDIQGEPFVGRAGQLLTDIIEKGLEIPRKEVFIGNINRCRPPGNRTPLPEEAVVCKPFLLREIAVVRPKVIVVLGAHAAQTLLDTKTPISKLRGHFHDYVGVKVMPTFHPAYLLRDPHKKREVWEDIKMVKQYLKQSK